MPNRVSATTPGGLLSLVALLMLSNALSADTFSCTERTGGPEILRATINADGESGEIRVAGVRHNATYRVFGFDRVWAFRDTETGTVYKLHIEPDGSAATYEDTDMAGRGSGIPRHLFECRMQPADPATQRSEEPVDDIVPIVKVAPIYPEQALAEGLTGHVDLLLTVRKDGTVKDLMVTSSTDPIFESPAIRAALKFQYRPTGSEVSGVKTRISFALED